jgi:hypothetical protein
MSSSRRSLLSRFLPKKRFNHSTPKCEPERSFRPRVERLEDRLTPTTLNFLVNTLSPTSATHTATTGGIQDALNAANVDTTHSLFAITFSSSVFTGAANTIQLTTVTDLNPTNHALVVTIDGTSVGGVTLRGTGVASGSGVMEVDNGTVNLTDLTISNGKTNNSGGGLYNIATMTLTNCTFTNDVAAEEGGGLDNENIMTVVNCTFTNGSANYGGGLYNDATMTMSGSTITNNVLTGVGGGAGFGNEGAAILTNCTITGNVGSAAGDVGGGILNFYMLSITGGTISGNSANSNGGGIDDEGTGLTVVNTTIGQNTAAIGGGVYSDAVTTISASQISGNIATGTGGGVGATNAAVVNINNTTINGNTATGNGGGIFDNGTMTVTNSTLSGNVSAGSGGGIAALGTAVSVLDSTLSGNSATGSGGGIFLGAHLQLVNSIVANSVHGGDLAGGAVIAGSGHDLIDDAAIGSGLADGVGGNIINHPASLSPLANNGGPTQTIALYTGSLAVNAGTPVILATLSAAATNIAASINLPSSAAVSIGQYVAIGTEIMLVTGIIGTTQVAVARAQLGTTAAPHVSGSPLILATDQRGIARSATTPDMGSFEGTVPAPVIPTVAGVVLSDGVAGDGTTQRSEVRQIAVTFSSGVTFFGGNVNAAAAFQLLNIGDSINVNNLAAAVSTNGEEETVVTLTFTTTGNAATEIDPESLLNNVVAVPGASLADGLFQMTILSANVTGPGGVALNGGTNFISPADTQGGGTGQLQLYRLFGDSNGDGVDDQVDLGVFRTANNAVLGDAAYVAYLDADNNGIIDQIDLGQYRARNNASVFPPADPGVSHEMATPAALPSSTPVSAAFPLTMPAPVASVNDGIARRPEARSIVAVAPVAVRVADFLPPTAAPAAVQAQLPTPTNTAIAANGSAPTATVNHVSPTGLSVVRGTLNASLGDQFYVPFLNADNAGIMDQIDFGQLWTRNNVSVF